MDSTGHCIADRKEADSRVLLLWRRGRRQPERSGLRPLVPEAVLGDGGARLVTRARALVERGWWLQNCTMCSSGLSLHHRQGEPVQAFDKTRADAWAATGVTTGLQAVGAKWSGAVSPEAAADSTAATQAPLPKKTIDPKVRLKNTQADDQLSQVSAELVCVGAGGWPAA